MIASGAAPRVDLCALATAGFGSKLVSSHVPELVALNTQLSALASVALATDVSVSRCYCILADTSMDSCDERCSSPTGACRIGSFVRISRSGSRDLSSTIPWCCPFFCRKAALGFYSRACTHPHELTVVCSGCQKHFPLRTWLESTQLYFRMGSFHLLKLVARRHVCEALGAVVQSIASPLRVVTR